MKLFNSKEKQILDNYFIYKTAFSKKDFENYFNNENLDTEKNWDIHNNIVTHYIKETDFKLSRSSMRNINKLNPDWNYSDENGETALILITKTSTDLLFINFLLDEYDVNTDIKNKEGFCFLDCFLTTKKTNEIIENCRRDKNKLVGLRLNKYLNNYLILIKDFSHLFENRIKFEMNKFLTIKDVVLKENENNLKKENFIVKEDGLQNTLAKIEKILLYCSLEQQLAVKSSIKQNKI